MGQRKNNVIRMLFILFCLGQLILDAFFIMNYFNQSNRLDVQDELISNFVDQGNLLQDKFFILSSYHNRLVESFFIGNKKVEITTRNFFAAMNAANDTELNDCIAQYKDPILLEELALQLGSEKITGYVIHLYDRVTFEEIGYTVFDENFVEYNIYNCGRAFYDESTKTLDIELV